MSLPSCVVAITQRRCHDFKHIARDLCDEATLLGSTDNITVLVVDLKYIYVCMKMKFLIFVGTAMEEVLLERMISRRKE